MLYRSNREDAEMEQESRPDYPAWEIERPASQQRPSPGERPDPSLPFMSEGLEQLRDSHC